MNHPAGKFLDLLDQLLGAGVQWHRQGIVEVVNREFKSQDSAPQLRAIGYSLRPANRSKVLSILLTNSAKRCISMKDSALIKSVVMTAEV